MADVHTDIESQVRQALDTGKVSPELDQYLALGDAGLSDRDRKLLQLLEDALGSGHVHRFAQPMFYAS